MEKKFWTYTTTRTGVKKCSRQEVEELAKDYLRRHPFESVVILEAVASVSHSIPPIVIEEITN